MSSPESFKSIVSNLGSLKQSIEHIERLTELEKLLLPLLPEDIRPHINLANLRDRCLVIEASSSAWATRIRYEISGILKATNRCPNFPPIESVRVIKRTESGSVLFHNTLSKRKKIWSSNAQSSSS